MLIHFTVACLMNYIVLTKKVEYGKFIRVNEGRPDP